MSTKDEWCLVCPPQSLTFCSYLDSLDGPDDNKWQSKYVITSQPYVVFLLLFIGTPVVYLALSYCLTNSIIQSRCLFLSVWLSICLYLGTLATMGYFYVFTFRYIPKPYKKRYCYKIKTIKTGMRSKDQSVQEHMYNRVLINPSNSYDM